MMKFTQFAVSAFLVTTGLVSLAQNLVLQPNQLTGTILACSAAEDRAAHLGQEGVAMTLLNAATASDGTTMVQVQLNMSVCTQTGLQAATNPAQSVFPSPTEDGVMVTLKYDHFQLGVTTAQNQVVYQSQDLTALQQTGQQVVSFPVKTADFAASIQNNQLPLRLVLGSDNSMFANGKEIPTGSSDFGSFLLSLSTK